MLSELNAAQATETVKKQALMKPEIPGIKQNTPMYSYRSLAEFL